MAAHVIERQFERNRIGSHASCGVWSLSTKRRKGGWDRNPGD